MTKTDFDNRAMSLDRKINSNKTKHLLTENEFKKLQSFSSSYFRCKSHFCKDFQENGLLVLVMVNRFIFGNLKNCLMKGLIPLLRLITVLHRN